MKGTTTIPPGRAGQRGLTLLEVFIAAIIFSIGMVFLAVIFPRGNEAAIKGESNSRAAILARGVLEGLRADQHGTGALCFTIGDKRDNDGDGRIDEEYPNGIDDDGDGVVDEMLEIGYIRGIVIPGNGRDDDTRSDWENPAQFAPGDIDLDGRFTLDIDGTPETDVYFLLPGSPNGIDDDNDALIAGVLEPQLVDDDGDSGTLDYQPRGTDSRIGNPLSDGLYNYDPEVGADGGGIDEEFADGRDNDGDGLFDEDTRMPSLRLAAPVQFEVDPAIYGAGAGPALRQFNPVAVGNEFDDDGDGEAPGYADGLDNNGDGRIDEGIDEEYFNAIDDDGDGKVDEDTRLAPALIVPPFEEGADFGEQEWMEIPRRALAPVRWPRVGQRQMDRAGDDSDNIEFESAASFDDQFFFQILVGPVSDGAADGIDDDGDSLNLPQEEQATYTDEEWRNGWDDDGDGRVDEDLGHTAVAGFLKVKVIVTWGGNLENDELRADPDSTDPFIDEEAEDGLDNDGDGLIDEDTYRFQYSVTGIIPVLQGVGP